MKKYLSLLFSVLMLLSVLSGCGEETPPKQTEAAGTQPQTQTESLATTEAVVESDHQHCICGDQLETHDCETVAFQPLNKNSFKNVTAETNPVRLHNESVYSLAAGHYYLEEEFALDEQVLIFEEVTICLNGKRLAATHSERTGMFSRIFAISGGTLNICDCCAETGEGNIQGSYVNQGGAILVQGRSGGAEGDLGTVNLYSGIIKGGRAQSSNGGTISVIGGTFRMYSGEVTGGAAKENGGNIYVGAGQTLELLGGRITDGLASFGTCIFADTGAQVILGGDLVADQLYLNQDAVLTAITPAEGFQVPVSMVFPGVFATEVESDLSQYFPGSVYDAETKTLSVP